MRHYSYLLLMLSLVILWGSSCRNDFEYQSSTGDLTFSKDTIYLDTVFSTISSSTYTLKVYNKSSKDVSIPSIKLSKGNLSNYRLNVDGVPGKEFTKIPLFAKDSMYIFIETTQNTGNGSDKEFLDTDAILFDAGENLQKVQLVTLVKDAVFLYPKRLADGTKEKLIIGTNNEGEEIKVEGFTLLDHQLNFTNNKPYVIYGYAEVAEGQTLKIDAGARVFFHKNSGIIVSQGASLKINGALSEDAELLEKEVIFEGNRLEPAYENTPGQWGTIWLRPNSIENKINYLTIKNATIGILVEGNSILDSPTLEIKNTQIYNSSNTNLWAKSAYIHAENIVLANAGNISLYCNLGGKYTFIHATIANYWKHGYRTGNALQIDNSKINSTSTTLAVDLSHANFTNCIIDGNNSIEMSISNNGINVFNFNFTNSLIKFIDSTNLFTENPLYNFEDNNLYNAILLNNNSFFINPSKNNFRLGVDSDAIGKAEINTSFLVPLDISGIDRKESPDLGPYQFIPNN
ncbi:MAG: hypothetical protein V3U92_12350 [Cellulophaga sp.]